MITYDIPAQIDNSKLTLPDELLSQIRPDDTIRVILIHKESDRQRDAKKRLLELKGQIEWDGDLNAMREDRAWS